MNETIKRIKERFEVIEDNGGGLTLFIFEGEELLYAHTGYEYVKGQLTEDLIRLSEEGFDAYYWENCLEDMEQAYSEFTEAIDCCVIADNEGLHRDRFGGSAIYEFGE